MKTILRAMLGACALLSSWCGVGVATEPGTEPEAGQVLLLDNERIVEGNIVREGDRYRVRRELGESWIPANKVIRLCASRAEAFQTLRSRTNLQDLDERLRLARWCQLHGLQEQGRAEVQAALDLRPNCMEAKRLMRCFQRDAEPPESRPAASAEVPAPPPPVKESSATAALPNAGLTMEAATLFSTRVQPILMNVCASCHAAERGGAFRLMHTHDENALNQRATQVNLAAAVAQVNRTNAAASPLLIKAVSIHGGQAQPGLKGRQAAAFHALEEWAQKVVGCMPEAPVAIALPVKPTVFSSGAAQEDAPEPKPSAWASETPAGASKPEPMSVTKMEPPDAAAVARAPRDVPRSVSTTPAPPSPAPEPTDEFDAVHFNRQAHPERLAPAPPAPVSPLLPLPQPRSPIGKKK